MFDQNKALGNYKSTCQPSSLPRFCNRGKVNMRNLAISTRTSKEQLKREKNEGLEYQKAKNIGTSKTNMLERRAKLIKHVSPMTRKDTSFMIAVSQESTIYLNSRCVYVSNHEEWLLIIFMN